MGGLAPKPDVTASGSWVPTPPDGQRKSTRPPERNSTGTAWPLTVTLVPPGLKDAPVGSASCESGAARDLPVTVAIAPGLQDGAGVLSKGLPESTSRSI